MNRQEFLGKLEANYKRGIELIKLKNQDYAGEDDPFKNFRFSQLIGLSVPRAVLMRMCDKVARISTLIDKEAAVKDETIEDTLLDLCNYTNILLVFLSNEKQR